MNRSHLYKLVLILFVIVWSLGNIWPPTAKNLVEEFDGRAGNIDTNFPAILNRARELEKTYPGRSFSNLLAAIGTNSIRRYFPTNFIEVAEERNETRAILNRLQRESAGKFKLGLDLQGGTQFLLEMDTTKSDTNGFGASLSRGMMAEKAVEVLRKRVDRFGVSEPLIAPAGDNRIMVQLPGLTEADKEGAKQQIQKAAYLEFRLVDPDNEAHLDSGLIPPGYELKRVVRTLPDGRVSARPLIVKKTAERGMVGTYVSSSHVSHDNLTGKPEIAFSLNLEGAQLFGDITRENVGRRLAIILDGEVVSDPVINTPITTGSGSITGDFSEKEAFDLAVSLDNPLQTPLKIIEERGVDPSVGGDSIRSGIKASVYGVMAVAAFMALYYLLAGVIANVALLVNILILLGVMCSLNVTYTLPGIAGIVLTVGMAVDANVLIFERIREEQAAKKSVRGAVAAGYGRAFATILDSQ